MAIEDKPYDPFEDTKSKLTDSQNTPHLVPLPAIPPAYDHQPRVPWRLIIWGVLGALGAIIFIAYYQAIFSSANPQMADKSPPQFNTPAIPTLSPTASATPTPTPTDDSFVFLGPTDTPTPFPGGQVLILRPAEVDTGWVISEEATVETLVDVPNHFGDSFLYAGVLDGKIYHAAFQFDLSSIPRGTNIYGASLRLVSLRADLLGHESQNQEWLVHILVPEINENWPIINYEQLHKASVWDTLTPIAQTQLGEGTINDLEFTPKQLANLERRILEGNDQFGPKISFRIDGPANGDDNLFAWDSGFGLSSPGAGPELFLNLGPVPSETPPPEYVIITSTPTPEHILTAVANSRQMTAEATRIGTATPLPPHWVTPWLITATPTPENAATAQAIHQEATAIALTTGIPPLESNVEVVTDTPEPVDSPTPTFVIVTDTPTPLNISTAVANSRQMTAEAIRVGTATPLPENWVTPFVVTATPTPGNRATAEYIQAIIFTTGTPTPLPDNAQTATPTPDFELIEAFVSPTATPLPTATPEAIPRSLLGKILFLSDREAGAAEEETRAYVFDPQTRQLGRLTARWPYDAAADHEVWSVDGRFRVFTKDAIRHPQSSEGAIEMVPELYVYDYLYKIEWQLTKMGAGISWGGVWSPTNNEIAFVSNESRDDEIWVVMHDGNRLKRLTSTNEAFNAREIGKDTFIPEANYHPSWSPNGEQIIFSSNRTGNFQIWIMNKDGSDQRLLMDWNPYNDFDPIWIKSLEPAPELIRE